MEIRINGINAMAVKKSLEFDYPPPKVVAFRQIHGFATVISKASSGKAFSTLPHAQHVDFQASLNSLTGYLFFSALYNEQYQNALIGFLTPFERYYNGNRCHAGKITEACNEQLNRKASAHIVRELQKVLSNQ